MDTLAAQMYLTAYPQAEVRWQALAAAQYP
jgi:hypothetical protein